MRYTRSELMRHRACTSRRRCFASWGGAFAFLLPSLAASNAHAEASQLDPTIGYNYQEIETPRTTATAGAQRALSTSVGALFINPANIAVEHVYHIAGFAQVWPEAHRQSYGAAASDSVGSTSHLAGAVGATYNFQDSEGIDRRWTDLRFALAYPFSEKFFAGLGGRYMWLTQSGLGPLGASVASSGLAGKQIVRTFSFDAGLTFKPAAEWSLSFVGTNLSNPGYGFMPTTVGGGIGYGKKEVAVEGDVVADFTSWDKTRMRAMGGVEFLISDNYALRGGYRYDQGPNSHALAIGAGYIDRMYILDLGVRHAFTGGSATAIVVGFTYHLDSAGLTPSAGDTF